MTKLRNSQTILLELEKELEEAKARRQARVDETKSWYRIDDVLVDFIEDTIKYVMCEVDEISSERYLNGGGYHKH